MYVNLSNRIVAVSKSSEIQIYLLCYEGSYLNEMEIFCDKNKVKIIKLSKKEFSKNITIQNIPFLVSYTTYAKLKTYKFDEINFIDIFGIGYHCIQAKKMGVSFKETNLYVQMFGPSQYRNEISEEWGNGGFEQLMVQYMERYCCQFCDKLISPTYSMLNWALNRKWVLCSNSEVINFLPVYRETLQYSCNIHNKCLIYCGELGKSGGLHLFINALIRLAASGNNKSIKKIFFIGEYKYVDYLPANEYIEKSLNKKDYDWEILGAINTNRLLEIAIENCGIFVFPSISGINGEKIMTAVHNNLSMLVSDNESHREIFEKDSLFELAPMGLINAIISNKFAIKEKTLQLKDLKNESNKKTNNTLNKNEDFPLVSIITAYYNHGKYIDMARKSIDEQDYDNIEWILIDDGSTDEVSLKILDNYRKEFKHKNYQIIRKENEGPSIARNYGANLARGDLLLFMDSDNVAKPDMVSKFVRSIKNSNYDCVTCYFEQFLGEGEVNAKSLNGITYALLGPSLEIGVFDNCFGDTNFIIKKSTFDEVGGFLHQRVVTEDWHILSKVALRGFKIDVIPESLFWYRILPESNVSYGSEYYKQQIILKTYCEELPPYVYHIFNSLSRPSLSVKETLSLTKSGVTYIKLMDKLDNLLPKGTKRRNFIKKVIGKFI
jgi:glycosyltransferase involved in cell wall biosynthesis